MQKNKHNEKNNNKDWARNGRNKDENANKQEHTTTTVTHNNNNQEITKNTGEL